MSTNPLSYLRATLDAAEREARQARGQWVDVGLPFSAVAHAERHSPDGVLRRIAADQKLIAAYEKARAEYEADGPTWDHESTVGRARTEALYDALRHTAEGWGWTEETT